MRGFRLALGLGVGLIGCGGSDLVVYHDDLPVLPEPGQQVADGGSHSSGCSTDCDCGQGSRCQPGSGEIAVGQCVPGPNTCPKACSPACSANERCDNGACVRLRCPTEVACGPTDFCDADGQCRSRATVAGQWKTHYQMDISEFAKKSNELGKVIYILSLIVSGTGSCSNLSTDEGVLACVISTLVGQSINAPPWVGELLAVLSDVFKFGNQPVLADGLMTLTEDKDALAGKETLSSMWIEYKGQKLNVMTSPVLGSAGKVTVSVPDFAGTRDDANVFLGPRDMDFDVNKLMVALLNVSINAATNGKAKDIGGVIEMVLCDQIPVDSTTGIVAYLACVGAANGFAQSVTIRSSMGGVHIEDQDAPIIDSNNDRTADKLALPAAQGALKGTFSNGVVSGDLGPAPKSGWYGARP